MAQRKFYLGNYGPFEYDDTDAIVDVDGDFPGEDRKGFVTDGQVEVEGEPEGDNSMPRYKDLQIESRRFAFVPERAGKTYFNVDVKATDSFRYLFMMVGI